MRLTDQATGSAAGTWGRRAFLLLAGAALAGFALLGCKGGGGKEPEHRGAVTPPAPAPGLRPTGFQPASAAPGDVVLITGGDLDQARSVWFGPVQSPRIAALAKDKLYALVPAEAETGPLRVVGASEPGLTLPAPFKVVQAPPRVLLASPPSGAAGTKVLLTGTGFTRRMTVHFGSLEAAEVQYRGPSQALATVPPGFHGGKVAVATEGGRGESAAPFHPAALPPSPAIEGVMITQGSQTPDMKVPLVEGRDAFLLVAVTAPVPGLPAPAVRIHLASPGHAPYVREIPPPCPETPTAWDPSDLGRLWTLPIPGGELHRSCAWFHAELVVQGRTEPIARFPEHGDLLFDVRRVAPVRVTLVPVIQQDGRVPDVDRDGRRLEDWVSRFKAMFPVAQVTVDQGAPFHFDGRVGPKGEGWSELLTQLEEMRHRQGAGNNHFYYGVVTTPYVLGNYGMGLFSTGVLTNKDRTAAGWDQATDDNRDFRDVFAHEMGHTLGLDHAPSSPPDHPQIHLDPSYPHPRADIGAFGFDVAARTCKAPGAFKDLMSYTPPVWISDHNYMKAMDFLWMMDP